MKRSQSEKEFRIVLNIQEKMRRQINTASKVLFCRHRWVKYARGYKCNDCDYYSGLDNTLNVFIKDYLKSDI